MVQLAYLLGIHFGGCLYSLNNFLKCWKSKKSKYSPSIYRGRSCSFLAAKKHALTPLSSPTSIQSSDKDMVIAPSPKMAKIKKTTAEKLQSGITQKEKPTRYTFPFLGPNFMLIAEWAGKIIYKLFIRILEKLADWLFRNPLPCFCNKKKKKKKKRWNYFHDYGANKN